ncbi:MAG: FecR family protein, partial [bacterium]
MASFRRWKKSLRNIALSTSLLLIPASADADNNAADLAFELAKKLKIAAADPAAALSALQDQGIIAPGVGASAPVTADLAKAIAAGMIKAGQRPEAAARLLASSAAAAAVPIQVAVQGGVAAAAAAGADVGAAAQAATEGAVEGSAAQVAGPMTKGKYIERFFVKKATRGAGAAAYIPPGVESLPAAEAYSAVVKGLAAKGEKDLVGSKPGDPLSRAEFLSLSYLLEGGEPGESFGAKKAFLKKKGLIEPDDIGTIKSYQGEVTLFRAGQEEGKKMTGNEAVRFKDVDETGFDARVTLQFDDGSTLTVSEDTALTVDEMVYNPKTDFRSIRLRLRSGTIRVVTAKSTNPKSKFSIVTPTLVAGLRGTDVFVSAAASGDARITANDGNVSLRRATRRDRPPPAVAPPPNQPPLPATPADVPPPVNVAAGNSSAVAATAPPTAPPAPPAPPSPAQQAADNAATTITAPAPPQ